MFIFFSRRRKKLCTQSRAWIWIRMFWLDPNPIFFLLIDCRIRIWVISNRIRNPNNLFFFSKINCVEKPENYKNFSIKRIELKNVQILTVFWGKHSGLNFGYDIFFSYSFNLFLFCFWIANSQSLLHNFFLFVQFIILSSFCFVFSPLWKARRLVRGYP